MERPLAPKYLPAQVRASLIEKAAGRPVQVLKPQDDSHVVEETLGTPPRWGGFCKKSGFVTLGNTFLDS